MVFKARVANYLGVGNARTDYGKGGWSWNVLECQLGRYHVRIIQDRDIVAHRTKRTGLLHTSNFEIDGVQEFSQGKTVANDLCRLLSFAAMSQVVPFEYCFEGITRRISVSAESMCFRPVLDIRDGKLIASYLGQVWACYRRRKRQRKLAEVIEMLTIAELPSQPLEVRLAQIFIILENLKSTYARASGIPFVKGYFREISVPPKANAAKEKALGFEELLQRMLLEVGLRPRLTRVRQLRNEIVHFGLSRKPYKSLRHHYDNCQDIIREYLLRYLKYRGRYLMYSKACRMTGTITS